MVATTVFGDRILVSLDSWIEWNIWAHGAYELATLRLINELVRPGDMVIDVGANIGLMSIRCARLGARVVSIEADPVIAAKLTSNLALNCLDSVSVVVAAAIDTCDTDSVILHRPDNSAANQGTASLRDLQHLSGEEISVPAITLDSLQLESVRLIKIDVEGAEGLVVCGGWRTIEMSKPFLLFEMSPEYPEGYKFIDRLTDLGYSFNRVDSSRHRVTGRIRGPVLKMLDGPISQRINVLASPVCSADDSDGA